MALSTLDLLCEYYSKIFCPTADASRLVYERPTTLAALSRIYGIYRQTCEDYGEDLLDIIRTHG